MQVYTVKYHCVERSQLKKVNGRFESYYRLVHEKKSTFFILKYTFAENRKCV
jgi:hypothetical protein